MKRIIVIASHNMKRLLFALAIVCLWLPGRAGERFISGGLYYEILSEEDATVSLAEPTAHDTEYLAGVTALTLEEKVTNPATGNEYELVAIDHAFVGYAVSAHQLDALESVTIPNTVTTIDDFYSLPNLKHVKLPDRLESLTGFTECPAITTLDIPQTLTEIGMFTFQYSGFEELAIPKGVKFIPYFMASYCERLTRLAIPGAEVMTDHALLGLPSLKTLVLPATFVKNAINSIQGGIETIWFESDGVERDWQLDIFSFYCSPKAIYCARKTPPVIDFYYDHFDPAMFDNEAYMFGGTSNLPNIKLYVPVGCKEAFSKTPYWGLMDIREYDFNAGVETVTSDTLPTDGNLYDLQGRPTESAAAPGIYVRDGRKILIK